MGMGRKRWRSLLGLSSLLLLPSAGGADDIADLKALVQVSPWRSSPGGWRNAGQSGLSPRLPGAVGFCFPSEARRRPGATLRLELFARRRTRMAVVGSLMKTEMITARPDESIAHAAYIMATNGVGAVLVVDAGKLVGILSERDVLRRVVAEGSDPMQVTVADVATVDPLAVPPDTHVRECSRLMREKEMRHLPVVRDGAPLGILSSRDLFAFVADSLERVVDEQQYADALKSGEDPYDHPGGSYAR